MGWIFVFISAIFETFGVINLKLYTLNKKIINYLLYITGLVTALVMLYLSFEFLQVSIAYAIWIGIGTASAVIINMLFFDESKSFGRVLGVVVIIFGVMGLKFVS